MLIYEYIAYTVPIDRQSIPKQHSGLSPSNTRDLYGSFGLLKGWYKDSFVKKINGYYSEYVFQKDEEQI